MDRILRATPATISVTFAVGEAATDSSAAVTIEVVRSDGTVVVPALTATVAGTVGDGRYEFTLSPADTALLDTLTARWTGTLATFPVTLTTTVEVVGGFHVTIAEIRAQKNLGDTVKFTLAELQRSRLWWEETFEDFTGVAWVPRYERATVDGNGRSELLLPRFPLRSIRSVSIGGAAFDSAALADLYITEWGSVARRTLGSFAHGHQNVVVGYEHGYEAPPQDVKDAALVAIRDRLLSENTGNRVFSTVEEGVVIRRSTPGEERPFGIPFVDEVARRRHERVPTTA